jgi:hypothetical protein
LQQSQGTGAFPIGEQFLIAVVKASHIQVWENFTFLSAGDGIQSKIKHFFPR